MSIRFSASIGTSALVLALSSALTSSALAEFPLWEDHAIGDTFFVGDTTTADGVLVEFAPVHYPDGHTHANHAEVRGEDAPCNSLNRIQLVAMTAKFEFDATIGALTNAHFQTKHDGGIINLSINSSGPAFANKWMDYDGTMIGGVMIHVISGGFSGDCTEIFLEGTVKRCAIALEEGWVDGPEPCAVPTYDDLALGTVYSTGDVFTTNGIPCKVEPFVLPDGSTFAGDVQVGLADLSCGLSYEIESGTAVVMHDFGGFGGVTGVTFRAGETGGGVNLHINGTSVWAADWLDLDGATFGGATVSITDGGLEYECTEVALNGVVFVLGIGGEEHAHDCIEWDGDGDGGGDHGDNDCPSYDDMTPMPIAQYFVTDTFSTDGILCEVRPQRFLDGSEYTAGSAFAQASALACGSGQELVTNASAVDHRFADSVGSLIDVKVIVADHGGQLNFEINGDFLMPGQYADLDGLMVGGVLVNVVSGGGMNECTELFLEGTIDNLVLGGGQHFIDCLEGEADPNGGGNDQNPDLDGDGDVDGADLAALLGGWGTNAGDIDGDGDTDGADLAALLGAWTGN